MRAILTYHSIDRSGSPISVDPGTFRRHLDWLGSGRVRVTTLDGLLAIGSEDDAVAVTFDDGFRNFAIEAAPGLLSRGLPVTLFVVSEHVGGTNAWGGRSVAGIPELELLTWPELGELVAAGVTLGSHTCSHPRLPDSSPEQVEAELANSARAIEREVGVRPGWLAYPYGLATSAVRNKTGQFYRGAVSTELRPLREDDDPLLLPRLDAYYFRSDPGLEQWNTPAFRRRIWARRQMRRVRQALSRGRRP